ncbi:MAG: DUF1292 domain-containing protein [Lachnospiraceae bacterium]|nr:DUF1292 domain-containing protein [Lachnospiraceae bacterium]
MDNLDNNQKVEFISEEGGKDSYYVLEEVTLLGDHYLLVTNVSEGDGDAYILKEVPGKGEQETYSMYQTVTDEKELQIVSEVFENLVEDLELVDE